MPQVIPLGPAARMLTTREAALRLGVSLRTVQLWVEAQILPAARTPGGHRRIPHNVVEALALSTGLGGGELPARGSVGKRDVRAHALGSHAHVDEVHTPITRGAALDVLLVANDPVWQHRCEQAIAPFGAAVTVRLAETGYLGLIQIGQRMPDVLVTFLDLPGLDGVAMLRTLANCESLESMHVVVLSHESDDALKRRGGLPSAVEHMSWPVSPEAVAVRVGHLLLEQRVS